MRLIDSGKKPVCKFRTPTLRTNIINVGAPWTPVNLSTPNINDGPFSISATEIRVPKPGCLQVSFSASFFDNNSARAAHRIRLMLNGAQYSLQESQNYIRDASGHEETGHTYFDILNVNRGDIISFEIQASGLLTGDTDLTEDSYITVLYI